MVVLLGIFAPSLRNQKQQKRRCSLLTRRCVVIVLPHSRHEDDLHPKLPRPHPLAADDNSDTLKPVINRFATWGQESRHRQYHTVVNVERRRDQMYMYTQVLTSNGTYGVQRLPSLGQIEHPSLQLSLSPSSSSSSSRLGVDSQSVLRSPVPSSH